MHLIKNRTHYANDKDSKITSYIKPDKLAKFAKDNGHKVCGICDYGNLSGAITFIAECKKNDIQPIVCCEMDLAGSDCIFVALNTNGWYNLIKLNSIFQSDGSISISKMTAFSKDIAVCLSESLSNDISIVQILKQTMKGRLFTQVDINNQTSSKSGLPELSVFDSRYIKTDELDDYKISLCCRYNKRFKNIKVENDYCLEANHNKPDRFSVNSETLISMVGDYNVLNNPKLPRFCEEDENSVMRELCRKGWKQKIEKHVDKSLHKKYAERVKLELDVFEEANLAGYFLIVQDFVNYCKDRGILIGPARGSAGGCLVSYLLNITSIDPMEYDLMFTRFYNKGRNTGDHVEYPDIDIDFPIAHRKTVIDYMKQKYGRDRVAQVITFSSLSGRGALKEVLRAHDVMDSKSIDQLTKVLPQDAEINDKMSDGGYTSIIEWVLDNDPGLVSEYCTVKNGEYCGELAKYFKQAARIEGTFKSTGKHAAGVVIGHTRLSDVYPMKHEKDGDEYIIAVEMNGLAKAGGVKFDILGIAALDKLMLVNDFLRYGNRYSDVKWEKNFNTFQGTNV